MPARHGSASGWSFVIIGAVVLHMGTARRAWRARNPGLDPLEAATRSGANVGSALGDDSATGRIGRWILVAVCAAVVLVCILALTRIGSGQSEGGAGAIILVVLLGTLAGTVGVLGLRRPQVIRAIRQPAALRQPHASAADGSLSIEPATRHTGWRGDLAC